MRMSHVQVTAKHNFTHDVKFERQQEHVLVTQGIYRSQHIMCIECAVAVINHILGAIALPPYWLCGRLQDTMCLQILSTPWLPGMVCLGDWHSSTADEPDMFRRLQLGGKSILHFKLT